MADREADLTQLVQRVISMAGRDYLQAQDNLTALRTPAFEQLLKQLDMGVALLQPHKSYFHYASESLARIVGASLELIYSKGPSFFHQITLTSHKTMVQQAIESAQEEIQKHMPSRIHLRISYDFPVLTADGNLKQLYQHVLPNAIVSDNIHYTLFIVHDLTGFKKSKAVSYRVSYLNDEYLFATICEGQINPPCPYNFTRSEIDILMSMAKGNRLDDIADHRFTSRNTVTKHRSNILRKAGAKNMVSLIAEGLQTGWLQL